MIQRFNVSNIFPLWLVLASSLIIAAVAFDIRFLNANTTPTQLSGWRSKRLTAMACHCCSNSFNSHCCLQCMHRMGKRGSAINRVPEESKVVMKSYPSQDSWSVGRSSSFSNSVGDSSKIATETMWNSVTTKINPPVKKMIDGPSVSGLLGRVRACARCLKSSRSELVINRGIMADCAECQGSDNKWGLTLGV